MNRIRWYVGRRVAAALAMTLAAVTTTPLLAADPPAGGADLGVDPSFAPMFGGRPPGDVLMRTPGIDGETVRTARPSLAPAVDLGNGARLVRLNRFGREVDGELTAAVGSADRLVLDLRGNRGGDLRRMLQAVGRLTGPVTGALKLVGAERVTVLAIPAPPRAPWRGSIVVLVGGHTTSSGEVMAALLRRHADATVLGETTWGKDYVMRVEGAGPGWQRLVADARIEVPGERLSGGLVPDGPIPAALATQLRSIASATDGEGTVGRPR